LLGGTYQIDSVENKPFGGIFGPGFGMSGWIVSTGQAECRSGGAPVDTSLIGAGTTLDVTSADSTLELLHLDASGECYRPEGWPNLYREGRGTDQGAAQIITSRPDSLGIIPGTGAEDDNLVALILPSNERRLILRYRWWRTQELLRIHFRLP
jgi:hypothetical protein